MSTYPVQGRSAVSRRAVVDIVRAAVLGSYGVVGFASRHRLDPIRRLLRMEPAIRVAWAAGLHVDLHIQVAHGLPVAEVARQVESAVRYALRRTIDREVGTLTIHVEGLGRLAGGQFASNAITDAP
jgi:uncharacterized alkaline shock family protein YloU